MSSGAKPSLAVRMLTWLAGALIRRPGWFLWPQVFLFFGCVAYTVFQLEFDMDRNSLVGEDKPSHRNFMEMRREFPSQDDIVVVVESNDTEKNRQVVERLGARLEAESVAAVLSVSTLASNSLDAGPGKAPSRHSTSPAG